MSKPKFHYECIDCGELYEESRIKYVCPVCSKSNSSDLPPKGVLKTIYNYVDLGSLDCEIKTKLVRKLIRNFDTFKLVDSVQARDLFNKIIGIYK